MWLKVIQKADCYLLNENLASYRVRTGSISRLKKTSLIQWHYKLFREVEKESVTVAVFNTIRNLIFGVIKNGITRKTYEILNDLWKNYWQ